jgi:c-di-GMP-binding flagellar brake protein YcgR
MDYRRYGRVVVDKEVECRIDGERTFAFLYDLSQGGCMIELPRGLLKSGQQMHLRLGDMIDTRCEVAWQVENCAGIRFLDQISEATVAYYGFCPSTLSFSDNSPRDRYGRLLGDTPAGAANPNW